MGEPKFTPGQWVKTGSSQVVTRGDFRSVGKKTATVADCRYSNGENDVSLIAAAPDMYEALKWQVRNCPLCKGTTRAVHGIDVIKGDNIKRDCERCADGRAAIAKAEGKT